MNNLENLTVIKLNGEKEPFSEAKIRASATRVGVPQVLQHEMLEEIKKQAYPNIPTSEIFSIIKTFLRKSDAHRLATKYNLKKSLLGLGPSGYPFEKYLSQIFEKQGYETKTNQILQGKCVKHEIDVIAHKASETYLIEAKFHNKPGIKSEIQTTLYVQARFLDLQKNSRKPWLITNTRFTSQAKKYADCINLRLTSWDYPRKQSLRYLIDQTALYPITILDSLSNSQKEVLIKNNITTCQQVQAGKANAYLGKTTKQAQEEAEKLCNS